MDDFEDYIFWDELAVRLTERDFFEKYGEEKIKKMDTSEIIEKDHLIREKYHKEFEDNGLDNIGLIKN